MDYRYLGKFEVEHIKFNFDLHSILYTQLMLTKLKPEELRSLRDKKTYLQAFCKQDSDNSPAYIETYIRKIKNMVPVHLKEARLLLSEFKYDDNIILIEICYVNKAYFFIYEF